MPGAQMPLAADLLQRLQEEPIIWFTTVSPRNVPTPNPVWFLWDGECIVVYSQPKSFRVRNIQKNPQVALTLQGVDGLGNHVCIINGEAEVCARQPDHPARILEEVRAAAPVTCPPTK